MQWEWPLAADHGCMQEQLATQAAASSRQQAEQQAAALTLSNATQAAASSKQQLDARHARLEEQARTLSQYCLGQHGHASPSAVTTATLAEQPSNIAWPCNKELSYPFVPIWLLQGRRWG